MKNKVILGLSALALFASANMASAAGTDTAQFNVKLTLEQGCKFTSAGDLDFGTHSVLTNPIQDTAPSEILVACSKDLPYALSFISAGSNKMTGPDSGTIDYQMFSDAARSALIDASTSLEDTGTGEDQSFKVYGTVPGGQGAKAAGDYSDTVTVTVTY